MQQFQERGARDRRAEDNRRQFVSMDQAHGTRERPSNGGEPAKINTRSEQRRIRWENDLYERQSS